MSFKEYFYRFLLENTIPHRKSWLSPNGQFTFLSGNLHHQDIGPQLAGIGDEGEAYEKLMASGWQRINLVRHDESVLAASNRNKIMMNNIQKRALINLAIENKIDKVVWENDYPKRNIVLYERPLQERD